MAPRKEAVHVLQYHISARQTSAGQPHVYADVASVAGSHVKRSKVESLEGNVTFPEGRTCGSCLTTRVVAYSEATRTRQEDSRVSLGHEEPRRVRAVAERGESSMRGVVRDTAKACARCLGCVC